MRWKLNCYQVKIDSYIKKIINVNFMITGKKKTYNRNPKDKEKEIKAYHPGSFVATCSCRS